MDQRSFIDQSQFTPGKRSAPSSEESRPSKVRKASYDWDTLVISDDEDEGFGDSSPFTFTMIPPHRTQTPKDDSNDKKPKVAVKKEHKPRVPLLPISSSTTQESQRPKVPALGNPVAANDQATKVVPPKIKPATAPPTKGIEKTLEKLRSQLADQKASNAKSKVELGEKHRVAEKELKSTIRFLETQLAQEKATVARITKLQDVSIAQLKKDHEKDINERIASFKQIAEASVRKETKDKEDQMKSNHAKELRDRKDKEEQLKTTHAKDIRDRKAAEEAKNKSLIRDHRDSVARKESDWRIEKATMLARHKENEKLWKSKLTDAIKEGKTELKTKETEWKAEMKKLQLAKDRAEKR
ncbi:hypothetical protein MRB53_041122 [Persea americana]|nr:hypothetical protein MRB53_041122 [Persea americana]